MSTVEERLCAVLTDFYSDWQAIKIDRRTVVNDYSLLAEEESVELISAICREFQIEEEIFYSKIPFRSLFEREYAAIEIPIVLIILMFRGGKVHTIPKYDVSEFAKLLKTNFNI